MKLFLQRLNWKNFLQRTILFFLVFLIIRILVDLVEGNFSMSRILQQSIIRYSIFAMVLGLLDSETWFGKKTEPGKEQLPLQFPSSSAAFLHYASLAFFMSLLCGFILTFFFLVRWVVSKLSDGKPISFFPNIGIYFLVIAVIGICFAGYEAWRNHRLSNKGKE
jgi:vacuolar-type H+-ATPase subunit I/STV1